MTTRRVTASVASEHRARLMQEFEEILDGVDPERARSLDAIFLDRLLLGRSPDADHADEYAARAAARSPLDLLRAEMGATDAQLRYPHVPAVDRELMWQRDDGLRVFFNLRDLAVGLQICQGTFDTEVEALISRLVTPGATAVDLGANLGWYTLLMARAGARVHSFEAFPDNHARLGRNVAENGLGEAITTHLVACSSEPGLGRVCWDPATSNLGSMFVLADPAAPVPAGLASAEVPLARVDDLVPASEYVDLVKIDVEGAEVAALTGMRRILTRDRPVILLELNSFALRDNAGVEPRDLVALLHGHGYRIAEATSMLTGVPALIDEVPVGAQVVANVVCFPE